MIWKARHREIEAGRRTLVMGIVNVTPDSFSDGGAFLGADAAVAHGTALLAAGADLLDIGGESSRPGSDPVPVEEELRRVVPVIDRLVKATGAVVSVDTTKARVAAEAIAAGAVIVNDISALRGDPRMADVVAHTKAGIVLMHMQGEPKTMQAAPKYGDVVAEIAAFLRERGEAAVAAGISMEAVVYDPGIGFGKTVDHNLEILRRLSEFAALGRPLLVGPSRKAFIGKVLGDLPAAERLEGTAAAVALAVAGGAAIVRVHDVAVMARVVLVAEAISKGRRAGG
ncbi:MAG: dihydropteroate synthase [Candidatus Coatesbacteria bacterium]